MIHSLSGGVIAEGDAVRFVKVLVNGVPSWYVSPFVVKEGDGVIVPCGHLQEQEGTVVKVELCTPQTAPVPLKRAREILRVL